MVAAVARVEELGPVDPDAGVHARPLTEHGDFRIPPIPLDDLPVRAGGVEAEKRAGPARLHCREELPLERDVRWPTA